MALQTIQPGSLGKKKKESTHTSAFQSLPDESDLPLKATKAYKKKKRKKKSYL